MIFPAHSGGVGGIGARRRTNMDRRRAASLAPADKYLGAPAGFGENWQGNGLVIFGY